MTYFTIGMALHSEGSHEHVLGLLTDGLAWTVGGRANHPALEVGDLPGPCPVGIRATPRIVALRI